jgi:hypothetical protein
VFPARVHNEPHGHVAWSDFQYIVDDYGGNALMCSIYFYSRAFIVLIFI